MGGTKAKWKNSVLRFYGNAVVDENVVTHTTNGAMLGYGLSVVDATGAIAGTVGVYVLDPPVKGVTKQIVVQSSHIAYVRGSTVDNQVRFASPATDVNSIKLVPDSTYPLSLCLRGVSSVLWAIVGGGVAGTTRTGNYNTILNCTGSLATSS